MNTVSKGAHPLITFSSKGDAWNFWWEKVKEFDLCPKLSGLQVAKGPCFSYQSGSCAGACQGIESVKNIISERRRRSIHFLNKGTLWRLLAKEEKQRSSRLYSLKTEIMSALAILKRMNELAISKPPKISSRPAKKTEPFRISLIRF